MLEHLKVKTECAACDTPIWAYNGIKLKKTDNYQEIDVDVSDGSKMRVGVCPRHTAPKKLDLQVMTEKIHQGWLEEVAFGIGNKEWVEAKGLHLEITGKRA